MGIQAPTSQDMVSNVTTALFSGAKFHILFLSLIITFIASMMVTKQNLIVSLIISGAVVGVLALLILSISLGALRF
jgi:hypothetical protein